MAGYYALYECAPNNEVLHVSSYHSVISSTRINASVNVKEKYTVCRRHKKPSTAWKVSYMATMCTSISTPCVGGRLSLHAMWGMCTIRTILCYFSDKRWRGGGPHSEDQLLCHDYYIIVPVPGLNILLLEYRYQ